MHDQGTPENIRIEVIQTTWSEHKQLILAFAKFSRSEGFENEQNLFIQSFLEMNCTIPQGCSAASIKTPKSLSSQKGYDFFFFFV